jgi:rhodanese-related sulfurtransferase
MACVSGTGPAGKDLSYEDVIELKQKNEIILIDVREPSEIEETGKLPGSVNIPRKYLTFTDSVSQDICNPADRALH